MTGLPVGTAPALASALAGTALEGHDIATIAIDGGDETALAMRVRRDEAQALWHAARAQIDATGRWPVLVHTLGHAEGGWAEALADEFSRFEYKHELLGQPDVTSPRGIIDMSTRLDLAGAWSRVAERAIENSRDHVDDFVEETSKRLGRAPSIDDVHDAITAHSLDSVPDLERWLFDWEVATGDSRALEAAACDLQHMKWFVPDQDTQELVFLPTPNGWDAPAYIHWFGAESASSAMVVAVLRHWHQRFGAELVCHYGTMLQLQVSRRPADATEAMILAQEHYLLAPCTTILPCVSIRTHARALLHANSWFLHERP